MDENRIVSTDNITSELLKGTRRIDEMKEEIHQIVGIIISALSRGKILEKGFRREFFDVDPETNLSKDAEGYWCVENQRVTGHWILFIAPTNGGLPSRIFDSEISNIHFSSVKIVHKKLPVLVNSLIKDYPVLLEALAPILEAAK